MVEASYKCDKCDIPKTVFFFFQPDRIVSKMRTSFVFHFPGHALTMIVPKAVHRLDDWPRHRDF